MVSLLAQAPCQAPIHNPNHKLKGEWNPDIYVHSMNAEKLEKENGESLSEFG